MNLGISVFEDKLLYALHHGSAKEPEFNLYPITKKIDGDAAEPNFWERVDKSALEIYRAADNVVLSLISTSCYLKRLETNGKLIENTPSFLEWLASIHLPGELSDYHYGFLPLRESFDSTMMEMILYATPADSLDWIVKSLKLQDDAKHVIEMPEQLGLVRVLEKSLGKDDIFQAGIVNCDDKGATTVYIKDSRYSHSRYFALMPGQPNEISSDIETYLLSRADSSESLPLVIVGNPKDFRTNWSPIVPAFMGIHNLEFAGAWGVVDYFLSYTTK
jgi:hypothetical protein